MIDSIRLPHRGARAALASRGDRFVARFVDNLVMMLPMLLTACLAVGVSDGDEDLAMIGFALGALLTFAAWVANMWLLAATGQTIGKRMLSLEVVNMDDGNRASVANAIVIREILFFVVRLIPFGGLVGLADALWIFSNEKRCLHDLAAKTHVVSLKTIVPDSPEMYAEVFR